MCDLVKHGYSFTHKSDLVVPCVAKRYQITQLRARDAPSAPTVRLVEERHQGKRNGGRRMLTVQEVARQLNVSTTTVRRLIKDGDLAAMQSTKGAIRVSPDAVSAYEEATWSPVVVTGRTPAA